MFFLKLKSLRIENLKQKFNWIENFVTVSNVVIIIVINYSFYGI